MFQVDAFEDLERRPVEGFFLVGDDSSFDIKLNADYYYYSIDNLFSLCTII
jgi:hypothetical protein